MIDNPLIMIDSAYHDNKYKKLNITTYKFTMSKKCRAFLILVHNYTGNKGVDAIGQKKIFYFESSEFIIYNSRVGLHLSESAVSVQILYLVLFYVHNKGFCALS